jgi:hypothetical protein
MAKRLLSGEKIKVSGCPFVSGRLANSSRAGTDSSFIVSLGPVIANIRLFGANASLRSRRAP